MINRINLILRAKNITARQFAEEIGIQPSGMSHILSGRNNPSLDFVTKVIRRYSEIDANWLLMGRGEMYATSSPMSVPTPTLFSEELPVEPEPEARPVLTDNSPEIQEDVSPLRGNLDIQKTDGWGEYAEGGRKENNVEEVSKEPEQQSLPILESKDDAGQRLERILFFYSDNTFREYRPTR